MRGATAPIFSVEGQSPERNLQCLPGESRDPFFRISGSDRWVPAFAGTTVKIAVSDGVQRRRFLRVLAGLAVGATATARGEVRNVLVFAAASLKNALDAIADDWRRETGKHATISYAASSTLAKQIENAAPADLFISADRDWMDYLAQRKLIDPKSRVDLLGNRLVLIA